MFLNLDPPNLTSTPLINVFEKANKSHGNVGCNDGFQYEESASPLCCTCWSAELCLSRVGSIHLSCLLVKFRKSTHFLLRSVMMSEIGSPSSEAQNNTSYEDYMNLLPKDAGSQRDISTEAVWSLSSCKVGRRILSPPVLLVTEGFGINQLLDERVETYWQSDGPQPHTITIEFQKYTEISFLLMYLDYKLDESYTPQK